MFLAVLGIYDIISCMPKTRLPIGILYTVSFLSFSIYYPNQWNENEVRSYFFYGLEDAVRYISSKEYNDIYVTDQANYTMILYYSMYDTEEYINTVGMSNPGSAFENPTSFGNYHFYLPKHLSEGNCYLLKDENLYSKEMEKYEVKRFHDYLVIDTTGENQ